MPEGKSKALKSNCFIKKKGDGLLGLNLLAFLVFLYDFLYIPPRKKALLYTSPVKNLTPPTSLALRSSYPQHTDRAGPDVFIETDVIRTLISV